MLSSFRTKIAELYKAVPFTIKVVFLGAVVGSPLAWVVTIDVPPMELAGGSIRCTSGSGEELVRGTVFSYETHSSGRWVTIWWSPDDVGCASDRSRCQKTRLGGDWTCAMTHGPVGSPRLDQSGSPNRKE